jgi:hypothetical protein
MGTKFTRVEAEITRREIDPEAIAAAAARRPVDPLAFDDGDVFRATMAEEVRLECAEVIRYVITQKRMSFDGVLSSKPGTFPRPVGVLFLDTHGQELLIAHLSRMVCGAASRSALSTDPHVKEYLRPEAFEYGEFWNMAEAMPIDPVEAYVEERLCRTYKRELISVFTA